MEPNSYTNSSAAYFFLGVELLELEWLEAVLGGVHGKGHKGLHQLHVLSESFNGYTLIEKLALSFSFNYMVILQFNI